MSKRPSESINIRISSDAWNLLRRAKFELKTKSYSETIENLNSKFGKSRNERLEAKLNKGFDEEIWKEIINPGMKINFISSQIIKKEKRVLQSSLEMHLLHANDYCYTDFRKKDLTKKDYERYFKSIEEISTEEE